MTLGIRFFSDKNRPVHLGPYPLESLRRVDGPVDLSCVPATPPLAFRRDGRPESIVNAMGEYQAILDAIRDGLVNKAKAEIPTDRAERAHHLKAFGYLCDAAMVGICELGRKVFISKPINHFELAESAGRSMLLGGGIGVTPMIAFAHRLHALGRDFALHYSGHSRAEAGFVDMLLSVPWADRVTLHITDEGSRTDLGKVLAGYQPGWHAYTCGPDRYSEGVVDAATSHGYPDDARHLEYFHLPNVPDYQNHPFTLRLADGREFAVPADEWATDVLAEHGVRVDVKCADGICGVCKARLLSGAVEHRDFALSWAQREGAIIPCQSRAAEPGGVIEVAL